MIVPSLKRRVPRPGRLEDKSGSARSVAAALYVPAVGDDSLLDGANFSGIMWTPETEILDAVEP